MSLFKISILGADINLTPNAVRALNGLGIVAAVRRCAAEAISAALQAYEARGPEYASQTQIGSGNADWVCGDDAWNEPLATATV